MAEYLVHALKQNQEWSIAGTTRDREKLDVLKAQGIEAYYFDGKSELADPFHAMRDVTHVLICTPPDDDGDPTYKQHLDVITQIKSIQWVGYLSTTGVYGDRGGGEVYETDELRPTSERGSKRLVAEQQWMDAARNHGLPVQIFRLSGIYGPTRSALDSIRAGLARRIYKEGHAFGRIHVEDVVNVLLASFNRSRYGDVFNVCDDEPAPSHAVIEHACMLLGKPIPPMVDFEDANLAPITRSFYMDNRRVKNDKIKNELGVQLKYPNYRVGLEGCLEAESYAQSFFKLS